MKDFINKLINKLKNRIKYCESCHEEFPNAKMSFTYEVQSNAYKNVLEIINELAKEYVNCSIIKWIPVSEQLPKDRMESCLATLKNGAVFQAKYVINDFKMVCSHGTEPFYETNPVIAWAPMPQGYVPEEREDT